jgi:hypothetical protein
MAPVGFAQGQAGRCDRECLIGVANQYIDALAAKDSGRAGLAPNVRYSENGQRLRVGDGLWNSVSGKGTYQLQVADAVAGQVLTIQTMRENGTPITLATRLKVAGRRITEVETLVSRSDTAAKNFEGLAATRGVQQI